jgi:alkylation response protein AidB-like acyl-CoA dehydrogenase
MLLELNHDQELFRQTTAKLLDELVPAEAVRRLRDDPNGFERDFWQRGAELGWTSLLVSEDHGGGSIGEEGLADLGIVAYEFGRHAAPGPLCVVNVVMATLSDIGGEGSESLIGELLSGQSIATWCYTEPRPHDQLENGCLEIRIEGDEVVLNGTKRPVESGEQADVLLVTGRTGAGHSQVLVPAGASGMAIKSMETVDLTRRFSVVTFDDVRLPTSALIGSAGGARDQIWKQLQRAIAIQSAEAVGTMQAAFDMTLEWTFDRYSFGRPLASYQELKHRFADMKTWLEASHAISDAAIRAVAHGAPDADELLSSAKAYIGFYGSELLQDCVQIHGGIGVTFDHDLHLLLRRHTLNRALYGTPEEHRQRLADIVAKKVATP